MLSIAILWRGWTAVYAYSRHSWVLRKWTIFFWRWIFQYRRLHYDTLNRVWSGTLILNAVLNLAGSQIHSTAKLYSIHLQDFSFHRFGKMAVAAERSYVLGHMIYYRQLPFGNSRADAFACIHPHAFLFPGSQVKEAVQLESMVALATSLHTPTLPLVDDQVVPDKLSVLTGAQDLEKGTPHVMTFSGSESHSSLDGMVAL
jgi:hypothetical protein